MNITTRAHPAGPTPRGSAAGPSEPRLAPGDELAAVVAPLVGLLTRASRRILRDDALADDAIQEALLAYWARGERPANPRAWLLHAVTLRSLHLARSHRRRREHERRAGLGRREWSDRDDPAASLDHADLRRLLEESLGRVPQDYRAVFHLWTFEEMDYAGIARTLEIPIGTVRSRLNRTRKAIRAALAAECPSCAARRARADADAATAAGAADPDLVGVAVADTNPAAAATGCAGFAARGEMA